MAKIANTFSVHLEPSETRSFRVYLEKDGTTTSTLSFDISPKLKDLVQNQRFSYNIEEDLIQCLVGGDVGEVHLHTNQGIFALHWDAMADYKSKTQLELHGTVVRIQKVLIPSRDTKRILEDYVLIGNSLIADIHQGTLSRLSDKAGWYIADLMGEVPEEEAVSEFELEYDPEFQVKEKEEEISLTPDEEALPEFEVNEAIEIPRIILNDKRIVYPQTMRGRYDQDLILKKGKELVNAKISELEFGLMIARQEGGDFAQLNATCLWDQKPFQLGQLIFKYFEYLGQHRCAALRKKRNREKLTDLAFLLLKHKNEATLDAWIMESVSDMGLDETGQWEATEYLRRFHKTIASNPSEQLLVTKEGWHLVSLDMREFALLFFEAHQVLGGDLVDWLKQRQKEIAITYLFRHLKDLMDALKSHGMRLYFNKMSVATAKFKMKVSAFQETGIQWFDIHPDIQWNGKAITEEEWTKIVEMKGVIEQEGQIVVLDNESLKALETLQTLLGQLRGRKDKATKKVTIPRLHILDWMELKKHGADINFSKTDEKLVKRLLNFRQIDRQQVPSGFRGALRDYQKEGYEWLAFLYEHRLGGCLADDMGLGKTIQAIAFLAGLHEGLIPSHKSAEDLPHLVVVPPTLLFNWKHEFENFYPDFKICEYASTGRYPRMGAGDIMLTTYDMIRSHKKIFETKQFHTIIFDEAQYLKNIQAKRTTSARVLKGHFTLTLTGTPLENHLGEYFSILEMSLPGLLGDYNAFRRQISDNGMARLQRRARPFVLRRTKDNILKELPPKAENEVFLEMSPKQKALYNKVVSKTKKEVDDVFKKRPKGQASFTALTAMMRLRQICISANLFDVKITETSPKIEFVTKKLLELREEDHSALVFSQFTSVLDVMETALQKEGLDYFRMDGKVPRAKRKALIDSFQCGAGAPIFLISLKTGGVGLNLTRASYVFHLDPWWNPAVENQASDRVHRIGQQKRVYVSKLLMRSSIEEKMLFLQKQKSDLYNSVLGKSLKSTRMGHLSKDDFDFLLS